MNNEMFNGQRKLTDFPSANSSLEKSERHLKERLEKQKLARKLNFCNSGLSRTEVIIWGSIAGIMVISSLVYDAVFNKGEFQTVDTTTKERPLEDVIQYTENENVANKVVDNVINTGQLNDEALQKFNDVYGTATPLNDIQREHTINVR